jgi:Putative auto-transporter adhesin, head GIN domain
MQPLGLEVLFLEKPTHMNTPSLVQILLLRLLLPAMLVAACSQAYPQSTRTVQGTGFTGLRLAGMLDVELTEAATYSVRLEGPSSVLDELVAEVRGTDLVIRPRQDEWRWNSKNGTVRVYISAPGIERIDLSGSIRLNTPGPLTSSRLALDLSGSGRCDVKLKNSELSVSTSGSSDVALHGQTSQLNLSMSGSGKVYAFDLAANDVQIATSGSADVEVSANGKLDVASSGSSDVRYKGSPTKVNVKTSGSGKVVQVD